MECIIDEVIRSNRNQPSVPAVVLEAILDVTNSILDSERILLSDEEIASIACEILDYVIEEVIKSNNRQPSIPAIVLGVITEVITSQKTELAQNNDNQPQVLRETGASIIKPTELDKKIVDNNQNGVVRNAHKPPLEPKSDDKKAAERVSTVVFCVLQLLGKLKSVFDLQKFTREISILVDLINK